MKMFTEVQKSTNYCTPTTKSLLISSVQSKNFKFLVKVTQHIL